MIANFALIPIIIGALAITGHTAAQAGSPGSPKTDSTSKAGWAHLGHSSSGRYYADFRTIERDGDIARFAMKVAHPRPMPISGKTFRSHRAVKEFNCRMKTRRSVELAFFSGLDLDGEIVKSMSSRGRPWKRIKPGSPASTQFRAVCE